MYNLYNIIIYVGAPLRKLMKGRETTGNQTKRFMDVKERDQLIVCR